MRLNKLFHLQWRGNHFAAPHLAKCQANYAQLSPLTALKRSVKLFPNKPAYTYDDNEVSYRTMGERVSKFTSALLKRGLGKGDVVSVMTSNTPPLFEAHLALPGAGVVLHPLNIRLDAATIAYQLKHSEAKLVIVDSEFNSVMTEAKAILEASKEPIPIFINVRDPSYEKDKNMDGIKLVGAIEYEDFLDTGDAAFEVPPCPDEWDAISLNYTSGTTGNPKGVVGSHRSAYLASLTHIVEWNMEQFAGVVMITPMFHANGWAFPWTLCSLSGCAHLVRNVRAAQIFHLFEKYKARYLIGAPITMTTLLTHPERKRFPETVKFLTAGSPPPPSLIQRFAEELNVDVTTSYGLTETITVMTKHKPEPEWFTTNKLTPAERFARCTRQAMDGLAEQVSVMDPETMTEVPADSTTIGEVMIKSNTMMKGYFKNAKATQEAFEHGWFRTGDLAVNHGLGRFEIKDRSKDIIISGGENISSIEVQDILSTHPGVLEAAVVAMPDEKWGEVPCAFVARDPVAPEVTEAELIAWARTKMAHFQAPKRVIFGELLKTATGKVQKHLLRKLL